MIGRAGNIHWASITEAVGAGLTSAIALAGAVVAILKWAGKRLDRRMNTVLETVGDWLDDIDDHLAEQDVRLSTSDQRIDRVESQLGVAPHPVIVSRPRQKRSRRSQMAERGFRGSSGR